MILFFPVKRFSLPLVISKSFSFLLFLAFSYYDYYYYYYFLLLLLLLLLLLHDFLIHVLKA